MLIPSIDTSGGQRTKTPTVDPRLQGQVSTVGIAAARKSSRKLRPFARRADTSERIDARDASDGTHCSAMQDTAGRAFYNLSGTHSEIK